MALFKLALLVAFAAAVKAMGPSVFFDEDLNPECCENDVTALAVHPNADDARDAFFDHLDGVATNGFEEFMLNEETPLDLSFPGVMATIGAGSGEIDGGNDNGQYAISGDQFLKTQETVTITFDTPIAAFGFYGIDVGDVQGQLTFVAMGMGGDKVEVIIPHTREESDAEEDQKPSGSVLYFGFIDTTNPFISATLTNTQGFRDRFAFDNFTIGTVENVMESVAPSAGPSAMPSEVMICLEGITNVEGTVCCCESCGACGGCDCADLPGGDSKCCPSVIGALGIPCLLTTDCGCVIGNYVPPITEGEGCF